MSGRLKGRIAVVTGGSAGIGRVLAHRLAKEGCDVATIDVNPADETKALVEAAGCRFFSVVGDVSDEAQMNAFADQVREALGTVDIVVNNAAIAYIKSFEDTTLELWNRMFAVNVNGYFLTAKAFLSHLKESRYGRVINIATTAYWQAPPSFIAYCTTKGAVNGFTHTLATELAKYNVTVNAIAPHLLRTPTTLRELPDVVFSNQASHQNLTREQVPEDVANMLAFLASDEADFITGQIHVVDGGLIRR